jgi:hemolysin activation/secretion protein
MEQTWAADVSLPGSAMPERVSKGIRNQQPTQQSAVLPPVVSPAKSAASPLGAQAAKIKFQLNGIILTGNTIYSTVQLRPLYQDKLHKTITVAELFNIVQSITNFYRNNGYILSRAILPPQRVKNGVVRVQVIEGYIGDVSVSGNPHGARCLVQQFGNRIKECRPLQLSRMERYLLIANEVPATTVKAVLAPSKKQVGAADLTLVTDNHPITGYASYDNYGTRYIGPQQMTASAALNSAITSGDATRATVTKTPKGGELTYIDLNYNMALGSQGIRWLIGDTRVQTHPLFVLAPLQIDGLNSNYYTAINVPVIRTRSQNLTLRATFNYMDSWVTTFDQQLYTDHLRSLGIGGTYNFADRWYGSNLISMDFRQGLPIWGYTQNTNPATAQTSRPGGYGTYSKVAATLSRLQAIRGPWSIYGSFQGQWGFNPLLASEQFAFGGSQIGRGYDVAELIGDKGVSISLELRYDWGIGKFLLNMIQPYIFYDGGIVWNYLFVGGTPRKVSATSTGFGARFYFSKYVSGNLMWAQPLTKQVAAEELIGRGWRPRVFFSVVATLD